MKKFINYLFSIMDADDKRGFYLYVIVLVIGSGFSVIGLGATIPFINILIQPEKIMSYSLLKNLEYRHVIVILASILILAFALKNIISLLLLKYQSNFLFGFVAKIQDKLFTSYMALPYEYHLNRSTPDLIKNMNNETIILSNYVVAQFGNLLTEFLSSFCVLMVIFLINPTFTTLVAVFLLLGIFVFMKLIKYKIEYYSNTRSICWSAMTENVLSGLLGIKEAKLYHCEDIFINEFKRNSINLNLSSAFQLTFQSAPRMLIEFIGLAVVISVLCGFILMGKSPQSMFVLLGLFGLASAQLLPSLNRLTQAWVQIKYGMPALEKISTELKQINKSYLDLLKNKKKAQKPQFHTAITLKDIHYIYQDGTKALNGITLTIPIYQKIAIVGESGAGKTTLIDLILGLYEPSSGTIQLDSIEIVSPQQKLSFQKLFAYVPQTIVLYDKTIRENIAFSDIGDKIDDKRVLECIKLARLDDFVNTLENKEQTFIGEGGVRLSGGQRQRIGIARALYQNPQILIMDEATSALDNKTEQEVTDVLAELNNLTIITIAHRLTTIKYYDVIYVIQNGQVASFGNYEYLSKNCKVFKKMIPPQKTECLLNPKRVLSENAV